MTGLVPPAGPRSTVRGPSGVADAACAPIRFDRRRAPGRRRLSAPGAAWPAAQSTAARVLARAVPRNKLLTEWLPESWPVGCIASYVAAREAGRQRIGAIVAGLREQLARDLEGAPRFAPGAPASLAAAPLTRRPPTEAARATRSRQISEVVSALVELAHAAQLLPRHVR